MTTRLGLYNDALLLCGERFLASLTEEREPRRLLDHVWNNGWVKACLERGQWWHAMRTVRIDYDPSITYDFGYQRAFTKPPDWVMTSAVCSDEYFNTPLVQYADERANWYADIDPIFVKYVSSDAAFGGDLSQWPESFTAYAAAYGADRIINKLAGDRADQVLKLRGADGKSGILASSLHTAKGMAAMTQPTIKMAEGSWTRARRGRREGWGPFGDGGTSGGLIG